MPVYLVRLGFDADSVVAPTIETVGAEATLAGFLRHTHDDPAWQWTRDDANALMFDHAPHLLQRVDAEHPYLVNARYLFDGVHAAAHPELLDREHIEILHGTMAAKLFDDGLIVLEPAGIASSLRWVRTERTGVRLQRDGGRVKPPRGG